MTQEPYDQVIRKYRVRQRETENRMDPQRRLERTGIPAAYLGCTWADYERREATEHVSAALQDYAATFATKPYMHGGRGLLIQGPPGVGKTMAACLLGVELANSGHYVRFMTLAGYVQLLIRQFTLQKAWQRYDNPAAHEEWQSNDEKLDTLREVAHLVIVDDIGKEHQTDSAFAVDSFDEFLRDRVNVGRPVVMTSNVAITKWAKRYSEAMESFVYQATDVISVEHRDDMRRRRRA